jgi:predicted TIM-barrel fold metal-dependent hydrolase
MSWLGEAYIDGISSLRRRDLLKTGAAAAAAFALNPASIFGRPSEPTKGTAKIIDIHPHIASTDIQRYPITPLGGERSAWSKERSISFEQLIAAMDEAGVEKAAIVHSSTTYGYNCSYVADSVALLPKRVTGVFSVDMMADDAVAKIRYWATERKLSGLRLFANAGGTASQSNWLADAKTFPGLECAQSLGLPVCVSLRMSGLPQLTEIVKRFPKIRFLIDHMIEPPIAEGAPYPGSQYLFDMAQYGNVYLKVTTVNIVASRQGKGSPETFFPLLVSKFGASRIAWGSNYPASEGTLKEMVAEAQSAFSALSARDREWIFAGTAASLYPMLGG